MEIERNPLFLRNQQSSLQDLLTQPLHVLKDFVALPSATKNTNGVLQVQNLAANYLQMMNFQVELSTLSHESLGHLLTATYNQQAPLTITLVGHADTVIEPDGDFLWTEDAEKNRITGPGVADDKGGLVIALSGLARFLEREKPKFNIQLVSSPSEEMGSVGWHAKFQELGLKSHILLGFEPALENGDVITSRHGNRWYEIDIVGREAHSGRAAGEEINAAHEWALKLVQILELKKKYKDVKINIGSVRSERDKFNVVCGRIQAKLDIRFADSETLNALHADIDRILKTPMLHANDGTPSVCMYTIADDCPALKASSTTVALAQQLTQNISSIEGQPSTHRHAYGASDLCYMFHDHCIAIDGLGPIGGHIHSRREYIVPSSISSRAEALARFLSWFNSNIEHVQNHWEAL